MTYFIRKKGRWANGEIKYIIQNDKRFLGTLPKVDELIKILKLDTLDNNVSQNNTNNEQKENSKFVQSKLNESENDVKIKTLSDEERQKLWKLASS